MSLKDSEGRPIYPLAKPDTSKVTLYSHDWADRTTWLEAAVRVVAEVATCDDPGTYTLYSVAHDGIIDTYHGKITWEDYEKDAAGNGYRVSVKVNGVAKTEQDPHFGAGGDYQINYAAGVVTFLAALIDTDEVTVTYHYATSSVFTIKPAPGKSLSLDLAEVQFSQDIQLNDSVVFQPYGYVQAFAPQYCPSPYPVNTLIPLGAPLIYKTMRDFMNDALKTYPVYPALGAGNWRGMAQPTVVFDWDYVRSTRLRSSLGMEIRVKLEHDTPFGGAFATATFYCGVEVET